MPLAMKRPPRFPSRDPRCAVNLSTELLLADDSIAPILVRNLSDRGFMGECRAAIAVGASLGIDLPGFGIAPAIVRWREEDEIGCQFRRPVTVERVDPNPRVPLTRRASSAGSRARSAASS